MRDDDEMDGLLKELGKEAPFPVDWGAYEREVLRRFAIAQARQRRRPWWSAGGGALAGAAAMFAAIVLARSSGDSGHRADGRAGVPARRAEDRSISQPARHEKENGGVGVPARQPGFTNSDAAASEAKPGQIASPALAGEDARPTAAAKPRLSPSTRTIRLGSGRTVEVRFKGDSEPGESPGGFMIVTVASASQPEPRIPGEATPGK